MPTYEYQCRACGHLFEAFQKMSDAPVTDCPVCQASSVQKLLSPAGFQLKGTGWYATDFKSKKPEEKKVADNSVEKKSDTPETKSSSGTTGGENVS